MIVTGETAPAIVVLDEAADWDFERCAALGVALGELLEPSKKARQRKPRRQRKPSLRKMIAAAERGGKNVTSITTPDGVTLHFGEPEPSEASNPWLDDLKVTKQ
jgi:hypothetical protein